MCLGGAYLQLLGLEHVGPRGRQHVVGELRLAVDVDRRGGLAGQEAVIDLPRPLGQLRWGLKNAFEHKVNVVLCFSIDRAFIFKMNKQTATENGIVETWNSKLRTYL